MNDSNDPYYDIKLHEHEHNDEKVICVICLEDDDAEGDEIVICEMCYAAAH